jgi:serine O-acetyltransferase
MRAELPPAALIWHGAALYAGKGRESMTSPPASSPDRGEKLWPKLREEATAAQSRESALAAFIKAFALDHATLSGALAYMLAEGLAHEPVTPAQLRGIVAECHQADPGIPAAAERDLAAVVERDPAATSALMPFLFFKGFRALQAYRVAHWLWKKDRKTLALYFQSRMSRSYVIDIHPAAIIGAGIMMDHGHGIVIGETAVVEDNVSFLHNVTLGGTGKAGGDRHPKIRTGVMIGAGAKILGNIEVGAGARIAAGSVVLEDVPPHVTVAGVPARIIGGSGSASPAQEMDQMLGDEGSSI